MSAVYRQQIGTQRDEHSSHAAGAEGRPAVLEVRMACRAPSPLARLTMITIELFIGFPAIPAGVGLIRNGLGLPVDWIRHSLFPDYAIPGVLLVLLIGGGMLGAAWITIRRPVLAGPVGFTMGLVQLAWLAIETLIVGWHGGPQGLLIGIIGVLAIALTVLGGRVATIDSGIVGI